MEDKEQIINGKKILVRKVKAMDGEVGDDEDDDYFAYLMGQDGYKDAIEDAGFYYVKNQDGTVNKVYVDGKEHPIEDETDPIE